MNGTVYQVYSRMTGKVAAEFPRYVDAFNDARARGPGWGVREK